jgi:hypothetical protein
MSRKAEMVICLSSLQLNGPRNICFDPQYYLAVEPTERFGLETCRHPRYENILCLLYKDWIRMKSNFLLIFMGDSNACYLGICHTSAH